jgi:hypothetical protein
MKNLKNYGNLFYLFRREFLRFWDCDVEKSDVRGDFPLLLKSILAKKNDITCRKNKNLGGFEPRYTVRNNFRCGIGKGT